MKTSLRALLALAVLLSPILLGPWAGPAEAGPSSDGGAGDLAVGCVDYTGSPCLPVACDGALCDTTTGSACSIGGRPDGSPLLAMFIGAVVLAAIRGRGRVAKERA